MLLQCMPGAELALMHRFQHAALPGSNVDRSDKPNRDGMRMQRRTCLVDAVQALDRLPKIALPRRTWVAPSWMAASKSALIPMDSAFRPLRSAMVLRSAKCGDGGSSAGGMHMRPSTSKPC